MMMTERRASPRRHATLRFRFEAIGRWWRGVAVDVSPRGAFIKSSHVPSVGTVVHLHVRDLGAHDQRLKLRGAVIRTRRTPSLSAPETGFALTFTEASSQGANDAPLFALLEQLGLRQPPPLRVESSKRGRIAFYRFSDGLADRRPQPDTPQTDPPKRLDETIGTSSMASPEPKGVEGVSEETVILCWANERESGHLERLSRTMMRIASLTQAPDYYESITLQPQHPSAQATGLQLHAIVTHREKDLTSSAFRIVARLTRIDEGQPGAFELFLSQRESQ